jgi:hypothetical protein
MKMIIAAAIAACFVANASAQSLLGVDHSRVNIGAVRVPAQASNTPPAYVPPQAPAQLPPPLFHNAQLQGALDQFLIEWAAWRDLPANHPQKAARYARVQQAKASFDRLRTGSSTIYKDLPAAIAAFAVTYRVAWRWPVDSTNGIAAKFRYDEALKDVNAIAGNPWGSVDYNEIKRHYGFWAQRLNQVQNDFVEREIAKIAVAAFQKQWSTPRRQMTQR